MDEKFSSLNFCNLATTGADGAPWNTPLFFVSKDNFIYWWSPKESVHSQNILRDKRVFITIYDSSIPVGKGSGGALYLQCEAAVIEETKCVEIIQLFNDKVKNHDYFLSRILVSGEAPTRLYTATIQKTWINIDAEENGYPVDARQLFGA